MMANVLTSPNAISTAADVIAPASWTPTDQSGAGLSLTITEAKVYKIGRLVYVDFDITFPATADGSLIAISLPFAPISTTNNIMGGLLTFNSGAGGADRVVTRAGGTASFRIHTLAGVFSTNANLSGAIIRGGFSYLSAS